MIEQYLKKDCLPKLTKIKQLFAYKHHGFWGCMDTIREKKELNKIWSSNKKHGRFGFKIINRISLKILQPCIFNLFY